MFTCVRPARAEDPFIGSLHTQAGVFALRAEKGLVTVIRADDRVGRNDSLRVKIAGSALVIPLRRVPAEHGPWRYVSEAKGWDGVAKEIDLQASSDGKSWRMIGVFERD